MAEIFAATGGPDMEKMTELAARYGSSFVMPEWVPELKAKYHLRLLTE